MNTCNKLQTPILVVIFLCLFTGQVLSASESDCTEAVSTAEMRRCLNERYQQADAELNRVYEQLSAQLSDVRRERLRRAQRAWIVFRDRNSTFVASTVEGGTLYPVLEIMELTSMTQARTDQLKAYLE
jgi:uncharacterized protein YecT (DUF1311 family)